MQSTPQHTARLLRRLLAYKWFYLCAATVLALDQATKFWIRSSGRLPFESYGPEAHIEVIPSFFNLVHIGNTGAAWSLLSGRSTLLAVFAVVALLLVFLLRRALGLRQWITQVSFGLICGGIAGNLLDRIVHKHVIDFLDFHFGGYAYPAFNIADIGIVAGVASHIIVTLFSPVPRPGVR